MGSKESGRRPKYSAAVHAAIVKSLEAGAFKKHAANAARISIDTLDDWIQLGVDGVEPYVQFALDVEAAIARDAIRNQTIISRAAQAEHAGDWKAAAWNLEKKHPKLYGRLADAPPIAPVEPVERPHSPWKAVLVK
jgi:hypothetical protein